MINVKGHRRHTCLFWFIFSSSSMANSKYAYVRNFELPDPLLPSCFLVCRIDGHSFHRCATKRHELRLLIDTAFPKNMRSRNQTTSVLYSSWTTQQRISCPNSKTSSSPLANPTSSGKHLPFPNITLTDGIPQPASFSGNPPTSTIVATQKYYPRSRPISHHVTYSIGPDISRRRRCATRLPLMVGSSYIPTSVRFVITLPGDRLIVCFFPVISVPRSC